MTGPTVRSVTVRLAAEVAKYRADIKAAGRDTVEAFDKANAAVERYDANLTQATRTAQQHRAEQQGLSRTIGGVTRQTDKLAASMGALNSNARLAAPGLASVDRSTVTLGRSMDRTGSLIDRTSGRLRLMVEALAVLGPESVPVAAVGAAGLGGLAGLFGAATVGALGLVAATQGVGEALEAVEKARLDPTVENIEAARTAMQGITPEAREFVRHLQDTLPLLKALRDAGAEGFMPGLTETVDDFERLAPTLANFMTAVGAEGGDIVGDISESLASDRWEPFLEFLTQEAPEALRSMSQLVGSLAHGAAEMWMAFDPGQDDLVSWALDVADAFDQWASSDAGRQDIQAFLAYARENGPEVADFLAAAVDGVVQLVQAAAPLGGPTLTILTNLLEIFAAIADSDLGTPLVAMAAGLAVVNRALAVTSALGTKLGFTAAAGAAGAAGAAAGGGLFARVGSTASSARGGLRAFGAALNTTNRNLDRSRMSVAQFAEAERQRQQTVRSGLATMGKTAAVTGALTLATTGLGESVGLSNVATMAMMGSLAGPWGAAVGAGVGLAMDFAAANDDITSSLDSLNAAIESGNLPQMQAQLQATGRDLEDFAEKASFDAGGKGLGLLGGGLLGIGLNATPLKNMAEDLFGLSDVEEAQREYELAAAAVARFAEAQSVLGAEVQNVEPAMARLGVTTKNMVAAMALDTAAESPFLSMFDFDGGNADQLINQLNRAGHEAQFLGVESQLTEANIDAMNAALLELSQGALGAASASLAYRNAIAAANQAIEDNGRHWRDGTQAARDNEAALQGLAGAWNNQSEAVRNNVDKWADARENFIDTAKAMGASEQAAQRMADQWMALPELKKMRMELDDAEFVAGLRSAKQGFESLPKKVQTDIRANGIPQTQAQIDALQKKYNLTPKQVRTIAELADHASPTIQAIIRLLNSVDGRRTSSSHTHTNTIINKYFDIRGEQGLGPDRLGIGGADGMTVPGPRQPYGDKVLAYLAPGEEVITNRHGEADRFRADRAAGRIPAYADGTRGGLGPARSAVDILDVLARAVATHAKSTGGWSGAGDTWSPGDQRWNAPGLEWHDAQEDWREALRDELRERRRHLKELAREAEKERDLLKSRVDALRQERQAIKDSIAQILTPDLFPSRDDLIDVNDFDRAGLTAEEQIRELELRNHLQSLEAGDPFDTASGALTDALGTAGELRHLIAQLKAKGFKGPALASVFAEGGIEALRDFATQTQAELRDYQRNFQDLQQQQNLLGNAAAGAVGTTAALERMTDRLQAANEYSRKIEGRLERTNKQLDEVKSELSKIRKDVPPETGEEVGRVILDGIRDGAARRG